MILQRNLYQSNPRIETSKLNQNNTLGACAYSHEAQQTT